jgi:uncharacterized membrane protein
MVDFVNLVEGSATLYDRLRKRQLRWGSHHYSRDYLRGVRDALHGVLEFEALVESSKMRNLN